MSTTRRCPKCGAELPADVLEGLCPSCVAKLALAPPKPGTKVRYFGDYELLEEIARGGMGVVFKARQLSLNRIVAVKMILHGQLAGETELQRFRAEAQAAANLQHPNIVAIHEVGEHDGQPYFSMDYIEGRNLAAMAKGEPLPARRAASYLKTIAEAVHYAHQKGTLHRDLKPSNVLIDEFDQPRITDFGLAKRLHDSQLSTLDLQLTQTGQVLGTPSFAPPEQAGARRREIGPQSDVYSLGAVLYFLLTARPPLEGKSVEETLSLVLHKEPVTPRRLNPGVPRDLETICLKCLEKDRRRRYATAQELADELGRFLGDEPIHARPVGPAERTWRACRRHPTVTGLTLSLTLAIAAVIVVLNQPPPPVPPPSPPARTIPAIPVLSGCGVSGVIAGKIYVHTGCDGWTGDTNHFHVFDPNLKTWEESPPPPIGHNQGAGGVINGKFYLVGGTDTNYAIHGQLSIFDPSTQSWVKAAPMRHPRSNAAGVVVGDRLFVIGGSSRRDDPTSVMASVEIFDTTTGQWSDGPALLTPRAALGAAVVNGTIYAVGGCDANSSVDRECVNTVEALAADGKWTQLPPMQLAVKYAAVAELDGILYVVGGYGGSGEVPALQALIPAVQRWDILTGMPEGRERASAVSLGGLLYLIGGWTNHPRPGHPHDKEALPHDDVFVYDPLQDAWQR